MSHFPRDRYSSKVFLSALSAAETSSHQEKLVANLLVDEDEIEVEYPNTENGHQALLNALGNIAALDNLVQQSCESECNRTGLDPANFDLYLAYIECNENALVLGYYGAQVNTEWDAEFSLVNGNWEKTNF